VATVVFKYGMPSWVELPAVVSGQLFLAHQLREDLVGIEHETDAARKTVWSAYPNVADAEHRLFAAEERAAELAEEVAELKKRQRTRAPAGEAVTALAEAREEAKTARKARRAAIQAARPAAQPWLDELTAARRGRVKALYGDYVQSRGLYWATYNDVTAHHRTALQRVTKQRAAGAPATLRHHRFTGAGAVAVQLQRGAHHPPRSPELLASGTGPWRNVLQVSPWMHPAEWGQLSRAEQRREARGTVRMRIGDMHVELPVIVHRMLPADADVTGARLVVERIAGSRRVSLHVTARIPDPEPVTTGPTVAIHGGWRHEDTGEIRVATFRASTPVTIPGHLQHVVHRSSDRAGTVVLPADWISRQETADQLRSDRDQAIDEMRERLVAWLGQHPPESEEYPTAGQVSRWRAPHRFARLAQQWRDAPPTDGAGVAAELESWRRHDRALWERQEHGRRKHLARRDDTWRAVAAWLTSTAGRIVIDDTDYAQLARTTAAADKESALPEQVTAARARARVYASPHGLRGAATAAAERRGVPITTVTSRDLSREHTCGHLQPATPDAHQVICAGCGQDYDRDANATALMLTRASGQDPPPSPGRARNAA
jgi:hypothetical protein